ncbi:MAG: hypothetical protein KAS07_04900 [Candidatus Pacebacteria bacterium]|nr:hypothetical protein [Candidatus Paceibacterota bacterium]
MPLDENDPEVKAIRLKLEDKYNDKTAMHAKMKVHERQYKQIQEVLHQDNAELNKIIGGINTLQDLLDEMKGGG